MAIGIEGTRGSRRGAARVIGACLLALAASGAWSAAAEDVPLSGRVLDLAGEPMAGVEVGAHHWDLTVKEDPGDGYAMNFPDRYASRRARTDAAGVFRFVGLKPGTYILKQTGEKVGDGPRPEVDHPIGVQVVKLKAGGVDDVELREVESLEIEARFVDTRGRSVAGRAARFGGTIAVDAGLTAPPPPGLRYTMSVVSRTGWSVEVEADSEGRVVARVPKGMLSYSIRPHVRSDGTIYTYRIKPGDDPRRFASNLIGEPSEYLSLGVLEGDVSGITFLINRYLAPDLSGRVVAEDTGKAPADSSLTATPMPRGLIYRSHASLRGTDGAHRILTLQPDQMYRITAAAEGYIPSSVEGITLPEGGSRELNFTLRRMVKAAEVGDLAPPFQVTTLDGRKRSPADYRGRVLLISFWSRYNLTGNRNLATDAIKAVRDRFGGGGRLAILGLNLDIYDNDLESKALAAHIEKENLDWPHARLGTSYEAIAAAYGLDGNSTTYVIGPDGTILAKVTEHRKLEAAVARALGAR